MPEVRTNPALGELEGFSLGRYLLLVDITGRLCRQGKARLGRKVASILEWLGTSAEVWGQRIRKLFGKARLLGSTSRRIATDCGTWLAGVGRDSIELASDELLVAFGHAAGRGVAGVDEDAHVLLE